MKGFVSFCGEKWQKGSAICTPLMVVSFLGGGGFNYDIMGNILPPTKLYNYMSCICFWIGNENYGVVYF